MTQPRPALALSILCLALSACQAVPPPRSSGQAEARGAQTSAGLDTVPGCAADASATLAEGVRIGYLGSDPNDPQRCLLRWADRSHALYFGFWSTGPHGEISEPARAAISAALTGPVGTEASFELQRAQLWGRVSVTHLANTMVDVAGEKRPALVLSVVRHDAYGRPDVREETHYTIDRATGVLLRSESVTPMANGEVTRTTSWQIGSLEANG
jgi:hypothetical protein